MGGAHQDVVGLDVGVQDVAALQQLERQEELLAVGAHSLDVQPHVLPVLLQHLPQVHAEGLGWGGGYTLAHGAAKQGPLKPSVPITALGHSDIFDRREYRHLLAHQHHFQQLRFSHEVSHPNTNQAHTCLASAIWQEQGVWLLALAWRNGLYNGDGSAPQLTKTVLTMLL